MSIFNTLTAVCPECATPQMVKVVASINADRRPDLRQQILDRTFQEQSCPSCGFTFRLPPRFTYQHFAGNLWIIAHPRYDLPKWRELEEEAHEVFDVAFGPGSSPLAQELAGHISPRVTFGWPALREKLVAQEAGLQDVELELLKMAVIRQVPGAQLSDETELRLDRVEGGELVLVWTEGLTEATLKAVHVPRSAYDEIAADTEGWAALRAQLTGHVFVDLNRLLVPAA